MIYSSTSTSLTSSTSSTSVWTIWVDEGTTATITTDGTWGIWNTSATSATTATVTINGTTWGNWNQQFDIHDTRRAQQVVRQQAQRTQPTPEQLEQWRLQDIERRARETKQTEERIAARGRARQLLVACLTPQQREDLDKKKCFYLECHSADGSKNRYRIDEGTHGNVKLLDDKNRVVGQYCVQPNGVPTEDAMLAQKLWLETNEAEFKRKANFSRYAA